LTNPSGIIKHLIAHRYFALFYEGCERRDEEIVDYQLYCLENTGLWLRGPRPQNLAKGDFFVSIGAAQTFGCFCTKPYPTLLQERLKIQALNLGIGGAGPYFFLNNSSLLEYINNAKFAVIQVMSGRSESNSLFDSDGLEFLTRRSDGVRIGAATAYKELLDENVRWWKIANGKREYRRVIALIGQRNVKKIIAETRQNWVENFKRLLTEIKVPKILFWFSKRKTAFKEKYTYVYALFGEFPQLVESNMIREIRNSSDEYIECISVRGSPQLLISRFTGKPTAVDPAAARKDLGHGDKWTHNSYYPSPEMHQDAANILTPVCLKYL